MLTRASALLLLLSLCACKPTEESHMKTIIGALMLDGSGGPPLSDSVVVVAGDHIREAGPAANVMIPGDSDKINGSGKVIIPTPIDVYPADASAVASFRPGNPASPEAARDKVARLTAQKISTLHIWRLDPHIEQAALEAARDAGIQAIGHAATQADARDLVKHGVAGFIGMISDTANLDSEFVSQLRNLRIFFAPNLVSAGDRLDVAKQNTRALFAGGVPIAVASAGGTFARETELLVDAGIPPLDVVVAATRNGAAALRELDSTGTIQAGKRADLLLLSANPGEDIRNLTRVSLRMSGGEWKK